jgi:Tfp pilus assembly protein PilV
MFSSLRNKAGMGLPEVIIAMLLMTVGITALLSVQSPTLRLTARSDFAGRAAGILQKTFETQEAWIMNSCNVVTLGTVTENVRVSGMAAAQPGDVTYVVTRTIAANANGTFRVSVRVTWPGNATGLSESIIVSRQQFFQQGC